MEYRKISLVQGAEEVSYIIMFFEVSRFSADSYLVQMEGAAMCAGL